MGENFKVGFLRFLKIALFCEKFVNLLFEIILKSILGISVLGLKILSKNIALKSKSHKRPKQNN